MAKKISITDEDGESANKIVTRALQSGNTAFLIGSGASAGAIPVAGNIEDELNGLLAAGERSADRFRQKKFEFLCSIQECANDLITLDERPAVSQVRDHYVQFLRIVARLLEERRTTLLSKQVSLFTTNYDLFVERAAEEVANLQLNDGFNRSPTLAAAFPFEPERFFDLTYRTGNLFNYQAPFPSINLIKLHGSLTWRANGNRVIYHVEQREIPQEGEDGFAEAADTFSDSFSLILPTKEKFEETLMKRVYYDLLRIFANTMEVENTVLLVFGFSFDDEHILDITQRALKNPTLLVLIFAYSGDSVERYERKFDRYNNVIIIHPDGDDRIGFEEFNDIIDSVIPVAPK